MNNPAQTSDVPNLNRAELISALDYEIQSKEKDLPAGGWTKWMFSGGFVAMIWTGTEEMAKASIITPRNVFLFFLLCSVVIDVVSMATLLFSPDPKTPQQTSNRIRIPSQHYPWVRAFSFVNMLRFGSIIGAYFYLKTCPQYFWPGWFSCSFLGLYVVLFLMALVGFIAHCMDRPIRSVEQHKAKTIYKIVAPLIYFSLFAAIVGLLAIHFWSVRSSFGISDYRLGMLLAVFGFLFPEWIRSTQHQHLLERLKSIRGDLAFQKIDVKTASQQADEAIYGLEFKNSRFQL